MPRYYRVTLDDAARHELGRRVRDPKAKARTRQRLQFVRHSAVGSSVPKIAQAYGVHPNTPRRWVKAFSGGRVRGLGRPAAPVRALPLDDGHPASAGRRGEQGREHVDGPPGG
jgi:hypothetical protein